MVTYAIVKSKCGKAFIIRATSGTKTWSHSYWKTEAEAKREIKAIRKFQGWLP